jgi:hypothetical protein
VSGPFFPDAGSLFRNTSAMTGQNVGIFFQEESRKSSLYRLPEEQFAAFTTSSGRL